MPETQPLINPRPELSLSDGSGTEPIHSFNTFALEHPKITQEILSSPADISHGAPEQTITPPERETPKSRGTRVVQRLLHAANNGKLLDYDPVTWDAITKQPDYLQEARTIQGLSERDSQVEDTRRKVAAKGLGFYASRLLLFNEQQKNPVPKAAGRPAQPTNKNQAA